VSAARAGTIAGLDLPASDLLAGASWPSADETLIDVESVTRFARADELIGRIRAVRGSQNVNPKKQIVLHVPAATRALIDSVDGVVQVLAGLGDVVDLDGERPAVVSPIAFEGAELLLSGLVDDVDLDAERARLQKLVDGKSKQIAGFKGRLSNEGFLTNAKPEVVADTRSLLEAAEADLAAATSALANLGPRAE
jgi:valyl-tRNA synthetase